MKQICRSHVARKKSLTFRFVLFAGLLVVTISILAASFLVRLLLQQAYRERLHMLQTSIAQTDLLFSQYLSDMGSYCQELYYSDAVRKIRVSDELTQADRVHVAQEIQKGLQQHQQLHSVYVINHNGNCFFHITNSSLFLENLESVLPKKLSEQNMSLFPFVWTVNSRYENAAAVSLLSMYMQAASFADPFYTGSVVVNCDLTQLTSVLFPSEKGDENPQFYIVDFQGHLIIDSGRQGYGQDLSLGMDVSRILSGENEFQHTLPDGTRQVVLSSASHYPGFYIAAVIPVQSPQAKVAAALLTLPVAVLFVCALCMYVSYMVGRKMFAPLGSLVSTIQQNEPAVTMENDSGDELQYLQRYYQHVSAYVKRLKEKDEENLIVKNLLLGNNVQSILYRKKILSEKKGYCAILLDLQDSPGSEVLSDYYQWYTDVCEGVRQMLQEIGRCTFFEVGMRRLLFLLTERPDQHRGEQYLLEQVSASICAKENRLFFNCILVSAASVDANRELADVYREMAGRLRTIQCLYSSAMQTELFFSICPIESKYPDPQVLRQMTANVAAQIRSANREALISCMNEMLDMLCGYCWDTVLDVLQQLAKHMLEIAQATGGISQADLHFRQVCNKIASASDRQCVLDSFLLLFDEIIFHLQRLSMNRTAYTMQYALGIMQRDYADSELNLQLLAQRLNISQSYLGRQFHEYTGKTVTEYLNDIRMEKAKELLIQNSDRSVQQIAADVGFSNPGYFATKFKKYFSISPTSFRRNSSLCVSDRRTE